MLREARLRCGRVTAETRPGVDPLADQFDLLRSEWILIVRRHLAVVQHFEQATFVGFSSDQDRPRFAPFLNPGLSVQIEFCLANGLTVTTPALGFQEGLDVTLKRRCWCVFGRLFLSRNPTPATVTSQIG